jgi:hypothetical protein
MGTACGTCRQACKFASRATLPCRSTTPHTTLRMTETPQARGRKAPPLPAWNARPCRSTTPHTALRKTETPQARGRGAPPLPTWSARPGKRSSSLARPVVPATPSTSSAALAGSVLPDMLVTAAGAAFVDGTFGGFRTSLSASFATGTSREPRPWPHVHGSPVATVQKRIDHGTCTWLIFPFWFVYYAHKLLNHKLRVYHPLFLTHVGGAWNCMMRCILSLVGEAGGRLVVPQSGRRCPFVPCLRLLFGRTT